MLASRLWLLLLTEVTLYSLGGVVIWLQEGVVSEWLLALALSIALASRALVVLVTFFLSELNRADRPEHMKIGIFAVLRLCTAEFFALLVLYSWLQPFERCWRRELRADETGIILPVLFIHGFLCNGGFWWSLRRYLYAHSCEHLYWLNLEPLFGDIEQFANQIHERIESLCDVAGVEQVILVGHSMGGLAGRAYLRSWGHKRRVIKLVTLGTPHHGTVLGRFLKGTNVCQMRQLSPWLRGLNESEAIPTPTVSLYSYHDNIVAPQDSSNLTRAENIPLVGIGHLEMAFSKRIAELVHREIIEIRETNRLTTRR